MQAFLYIVLALASFCQDVVAAHLDLRFSLTLKRRVADRMCGDESCSELPYTISLLSADNDDFDLKAVMMQVGNAKPSRAASFYDQHPDHHVRFVESTLIRIPQNLLTKKHRLLAGIRLYDVPLDVQDFYILDLSRVASGREIAVTFSVGGSGQHFVAKLQMNNAVQLDFSSPCNCKGYTCQCCEHLDIPKIELNETGCVNLIYLPSDYGVELTFTLNGVIIYNDTWSLRNPPAVCFQVPYLKEYASLCLRLHDLKVEGQKLNGCIEVEAELYHVRVYSRDLGCFHFPLSFADRLRRYAVARRRVH